MHNNTIKYFLYARKSSEGEDRQITSIEDQISEVKKLAKERGLEIVDIITESKSAKEPGRVKFNEMLSRIDKGKEAQGILCWKLNRLARNPIDGGRISWMLQQNIIQHIQTFGRDYKPADNVIMMQVEFGMSNQYVKDLSVDVKRGMRKKAERGWYPISKLPLGYIHNPYRTDNNSDEIIPDSKYYQTIKKLWGLLLTGIYSISDIKREGDSLGLVNNNGNFYSVSSYHYIFSNEFYCGYYFWNDEKGNKIRYLGKHKPMISELQFRKVQEVYVNNSNPTRKRKYYFPYRGLIACGECNGFVTAENKLQAICTHCKYKFSIKTKNFCPKCKLDISKMKKPSIINKTYYHCTKKIKKDCSQGSITDIEIDKFLLQNLEQISINKDFFKFAIKGLKMLNENNNSDDNKIIIQLKKRKTELSNRTTTLLQMRADNEITKEQLYQMNLSTSEEIKSFEFKILSMEYIKNNWLKVAQEKLDYTFHSLKKFKNGDEKIKKHIASKIGSNLTLKDKSLYFKRLEAHLMINKCSTAYSKEKDRLEPEIPIENKGEFNDFDALFPVMLPHLKSIRTYLIDNFSIPKS